MSKTKKKSLNDFQQNAYNEHLKKELTGLEPLDIQLSKSAFIAGCFPDDSTKTKEENFASWSLRSLSGVTSFTKKVCKDFFEFGLATLTATEDEILAAAKIAEDKKTASEIKNDVTTKTPVAKTVRTRTESRRNSPKATQRKKDREPINAKKIKNEKKPVSKNKGGKNGKNKK